MIHVLLHVFDSKHKAVNVSEELALSAESAGSASNIGPAQAMHIVPLIVSERAFQPDVTHEYFVMRLLTGCMES